MDWRSSHPRCHLTKESPTRRQSQRPQLSRPVLTHVSRQLRPRLVFNVRQMKITGTAFITGRGHAIITDEPWTIATCQSVAKKKKIRVADGDRVVEIDIKSVEAALKNDRIQYLSFLVPAISEKKIEEFLQNREITLA